MLPIVFDNPDDQNRVRYKIKTRKHDCIETVTKDSISEEQALFH
jgi:hypothetical protein